MKKINSLPIPSPNPGGSWMEKLGPGLITGAADDDPSGIATYSQAGARFGLNLLWTMVITYPLMVGIQMISANIGRVSGRGLASNIRLHYPAWLLYSAVGLLVGANTINIAADVAAMGEALKLIVGGPRQLYTAGFGLLSLLLQVFVPYHHYVRVLKWLTLSLFAYVGTAFVVHIPWAEVALRTVWPHISWTRDYFTTVVAVFGTTISPYLFFWQTSQEVENIHADPAAHPLRRAPDEAVANLGRIRLDTMIGMGFSSAVGFFIVLTTAVTLNLHGITNIVSSSQAASALRPIAGELAFILFSTGIIGTGLLALPVLAGSAAYAVSGAFIWRNSLERKPATAKRFYGIIALSIVAGVLLGFTPLDPIKALFWSAVVNGVISVPIMAVMMMLAVRSDVMGEFGISRGLCWLGWLGTGTMALTVVAMLVTL